MYRHSLVPRPRPSTRQRGSGNFSRFFCARDTLMRMRISANRIVSCPGGGVWVAVTRDFERDICVTSKILQSDWTIQNRAGVPRKWTKVPRPSFHVWAGRSGHETIVITCMTSLKLGAKRKRKQTCINVSHTRTETRGKCFHVNTYDQHVCEKTQVAPRLNKASGINFSVHENLDHCLLCRLLRR